MSMRVVECNICGDVLAAANDEELLDRLRGHMELEGLIGTTAERLSTEEPRADRR